METKRKICFSCGNRIPEGGIYYNIELKITSGFDGIINERPSPQRIRDILKSLEDLMSIEAEEDVFKEIQIELCKSCKDKLISTLVGERIDQSISDKN